jgi:hypothetical protein
MVKIFSRTLLLFLISTSLKAQVQQWQLVTNDQTYLQSMYAMVFTSHDTGYFLSANGSKMIRTVDSGDHFTTLKLPNNASGSVTNMSWPTNTCGYVAYASSRTLLVRTHDAGNTWDAVAVKPDNLSFFWISFPTPDVGYATAGLKNISSNTDTGYCVAKSTDSGKTWKILYEPGNNSTIDPVGFADASKGIFFDVIKGNSIVMDVTYNGLTTVKSSKLIAVDNGGQRFLKMLDDSTWIVCPGSPAELDRTTDSGRTWKPVVKAGPSDPAFFPSTGDITTACFRDNLGFAFEDLGSICYATTDKGATWIPALTTNATQTRTLQSASAASFPAQTIAYALGTDSASSPAVMLLKIDLPAPPQKGVAAAHRQQNDFTAAVNGQLISFTAPALPETRSIEIMDLLGRPCASVSLTPHAQTATLSRNTLRPGTYFARLGSALAKFTVWN